MPETTSLTPLEARRAEVAQYEQNIKLYEAILANLPTEFPEKLLRFKGAKNQHEAIAEIEDLVDVELLSKLWYADECRKAIKTEMIEMTKSKSILEILEAETNL